MKNISEAINEMPVPEPQKGIHSELHELVDAIRKDFGENSTRGKGSFGFYLRLLKDVPVPTIYMWFKDIKSSPKLDTPLARCKVFWYKYRVRKYPNRVI